MYLVKDPVLVRIAWCRPDCSEDCEIMFKIVPLNSAGPVSRETVSLESNGGHVSVLNSGAF